MIQRYRLRYVGGTDTDPLIESVGGDYILYADYIAEIAKKDKEIKEVERISRFEYDNYLNVVGELQEEIAALKIEAQELHDKYGKLWDENAALKEKIKEQDEEVYCPTCGACGEEGCCPPDRCEHLRCFYGEHYAKTYRELEAENGALRSLVDGVTEIVEIWAAESPSQKVWKADWLKKAREALK